MAEDEYFLEEINKGKLQAVLRLYTMKEPAITVGRFFKKKYLLKEVIEKDRVQVVRRITGGNAVLHEGDLTYSFICQKGIYSITDTRSLYLFVASILQKALELAGISCTIHKDLKVIPNTPGCFDSVSQYEITADSGQKIVGSAQKIVSSACIQQGSIFYSSLPSAIASYINVPRRNDVEELMSGGPGNDLSKGDELISLIRSGFEEYFTTLEYGIDVRDREQIEKLVLEKYANPLWNYNR